MKHYLPLWLLLFLVWHWPNVARATAGPPATGRSLAEALNPDGTLRAGASGSFDARAFRMRTAPDGRPVFRPAGTAGAGDERWQSGFGLPDATNGTVYAVVQTGGNLYIGGSFSTVNNVLTNGVAKWNGTVWSALATGVTDGSYAKSVFALATASNGDIYAGGDFTQAGGGDANRIARWNGTTWSSLGTGTTNGVNSTVNALAVAANGGVYVGGFFTQAGGTAANAVARWNGGAWSALGTGAANGVSGGAVLALAAASTSELYVGGAFNQAGGVAANRIARWDGTAWTALGAGGANGVSGGNVLALAVGGSGKVYVGGNFMQAGAAAANGVAEWNGSAWSALGTTSNGVSGGTVYALTAAGNGDVYIGGSFNGAGGSAASRIARWNGTAWNEVGTGVSDGSNGGAVFALATAGSNVYAGGIFTQAGAVATSNFALWNGSVWGTLGSGSGGNGVSSEIFAIAVAGNGEVYVGGRFRQVGRTAANRVAKWNGTAWSALGSGATRGLNAAAVYALAVSSTGDVYMGGDFAEAGGTTANKVAKWNGLAWSALGAGFAVGVSGGDVMALAVADNGDLYVGGGFTQAGSTAATGVAKWNGTAWSTLGTGTANGVSGGAVYTILPVGNGEVYVGGEFSQAGGAPANSVAKWSGTAWSTLGAGVANGVRYGGQSAAVLALATTGNGEVYVGGTFNQAGGIAANQLARWNGTTWDIVGQGTTNGVGPGAVTALAFARNGRLYVGGVFTRVGGIAASQVASWDGTAWSALGTGLNNYPHAMAAGQNDNLYLGGIFSATGDGSKIMVRFAVYNANAPLATTAAARATPAAQLFPNPAHGTATLRLPAAAARLPLTLTDALGRLVRQYPAPAGPKAVLDLRGLPAGVYLVRCGELSQRLVVE